MRVVVTRPAGEGAEWVDALRGQGFDAVALPLIAIVPTADPAPLRDAWMRCGEYRAAMFVSANAVRAFFAARPPGLDFTPRAWAPGAGTRSALLDAGVHPRAIDSPPADAGQFDSEALWSAVAGQCGPGDHVLVVRGGEGRDWLQQRLAREGVSVATVSAYARARPHWTAAEQAIAARSATGTWLFSSSEGIANLRAAMPQQDWSAARAIATHPRIAEAARAAGFGVVCESRPVLRDVVAALESAG